MAKLPLVMCRICGRRDIDRNTQEEGKDWVQGSPKWFYHKSCYDLWKHTQGAKYTEGPEEIPNAQWIDAIWAYMMKEKKIELNFTKVKSQFENFVRKGYTPKGIYFAVKYYYDIEHGDKSKAEGGIGIVPYIYNKAAEYWTKLEIQKQGIVENITQQALDLAQREKVVIKRKRKKKPQKQWDLNNLGD